MLKLFVLVVAVYGVIVGSALNALVWRLHTKRSWIKGRSMCPSCRHVLAPIDLIPILSWLALRGHCRYCHKIISWQYPVVEVVTSSLFALSAYTLRPVGPLLWIEFVLWLLLLALFVALVVCDLRWMLLPDRLTYPAGIVAIGMVLVRVAASAQLESLWGPLAAGLGAAIMFWLIATITRGRGMGGGDIKLVFVMGLALGLPRMALGLLLAFNVGALVGVLLLITRRLGKSHLLPFGPFLIGGTIVAYLYGDQLIAFYLKFSGVNG